MESLPSQPGGGDVSEDIGGVAGDISAVGERQIRITGAAEGNLALSEFPAQGPTGRRMGNPNRWARMVLLTGRGSSRARDQ